MTAGIKKVIKPAIRAGSMPSPTVAASFARALLELAVAKGADQSALLARSKIDVRELNDPDGRVPLAKFKALMRAGKELSGDRALALHFGEAFDFAELSIVSVIGHGSATVGDAIALQKRFSPLVVEVSVPPGIDRFTFQRDARGLWLIDNRANPNDFPELTEAAFARTACTGRRAGMHGLMKEVHVTHNEPGYRAEYDRIFGVPIVFDSDKNAILAADDNWLSREPPRQHGYVAGLLSTRAEVLLKKLEDSKSFRGRVEALLVPVLQTGDVGADEIARQLGVSPRTLSRRLKSEGLTFEQVLGELRRKVALHYLNEEGASVSDTARRVGFSDRASFSRAFKRWTGSPPRAARARRLKARQLTNSD